MATMISSGMVAAPVGKRRGRKPGLNSTVAQRSAANARERSRMRVLSGAFVELKGALPWVPKDTKLSKLDTLKLASGYIAYLRRILDTSSDSEDSQNDVESILYDAAASSTLHLFSLATQTTEVQRPFCDSPQSYSKSREFSVPPSEPRAELTSHLCEGLKPFFQIPQNPTFSNCNFPQYVEDFRQDCTSLNPVLYSVPVDRENTPFSHITNPPCDKNKCDHPGSNHGGGYFHDRPEHNLSRSSDEARRNGLLLPRYVDDAKVLNTELTRILNPTVRTMWDNRRSETPPSGFPFNGISSAYHFPHMANSANFPISGNLGYQGAQIR